MRHRYDMRKIFRLVEDKAMATKVWMLCGRDEAAKIVDTGLTMEFAYSGEFGHGLYFFDTPQAAAADTNDEDEHQDTVVLEFQIDDEAQLKSVDSGVLNRYQGGLGDRTLAKKLVRRGIDGVIDDHLICIYNPDLIHFTRVWSGVIDDPLSQTETGELDEVALGGLHRCTAVTIDALLKHFRQSGIGLGEVPVDHPGVLTVLARHRLAYRPDPTAAGRSVQQFVGLHHIGAWYLLTPGHAMAAIDGELFDAEGKGLDGRRLMNAFLITHR
jgi:hypothetical protein